MASRGCAFDCHYCSGRTLSGGRIRFRPVTNLVDEIQECQRQYGITSFHFADDNFLQNPGYVRSFRQELGNRGLSISWRSFARADSIRPEIMEDVAASGCYRLTLGLESGTDTILLRMNKRHTVEQSSAALSLCREYGIETKAFFMLGYPEETPAEIQATIDFAAASSLSHAYFYLVRSFPGTRLERELLEAGIPKADLLEYIHWVPDMDSGLTVFERACRKALEVHGVFDADSVLKYNVAHRRSINRNCSNEQLMDFMVNGYKKFYFRPSYLERFPWWADVTNEKTLEQQEVGI
ncbi:MAG TPA: radical SAM protein [Candidatus Ozemobacteraceae bacterium]|nr:radical SAM protein [Candidatus Ozemobacteraceae bacterium]